MGNPMPPDSSLRTILTRINAVPATANRKARQPPPPVGVSTGRMLPLAKSGEET